tara:strand:+ start:1009 stop:1179 length:171 start_codon:yes stop_codon:yes gene_type:complete
MDEIKRLLLDARDSLEWLMGTEELDLNFTDNATRDALSRAGEIVEEIDRIFGRKIK